MRKRAYTFKIVVIVGRWWPLGAKGRLDLLPIRHVNLAEIDSLARPDAIESGRVGFLQNECLRSGG